MILIIRHFESSSSHIKFAPASSEGQGHGRKKLNTALQRAPPTVRILLLKFLANKISIHEFNSTNYKLKLMQLIIAGKESEGGHERKPEDFH